MISKAQSIERRVIKIADYVIKEKCTVRQAAKKFGVSKSTAHKDLRERLPQFDRGRSEKVEDVLETNKRERTYRGGLATQAKYKKAQ